MWVCPKCGREFARKNQAHYCEKAPETVHDYIQSQPTENKIVLTQMASILKNSLSDINERILWSMPYYERNGKTLSFSACKKHISFYVGAQAIEKFATELQEFQTVKNAIYFPYEKELPETLIENIARWRFC